MSAILMAGMRRHDELFVRRRGPHGLQNPTQPHGELRFKDLTIGYCPCLYLFIPCARLAGDANEYLGVSAPEDYAANAAGRECGRGDSDCEDCCNDVRKDLGLGEV